jgi:hypothetical protein
MPYARSKQETTMFGPVSMRIHPIFTEPKDFDGNGSLDGIEVLVELTDQFGDPTKATGQVLFELYTVRKYNTDPREALLESWVMPIQTLREQKEHWRRIGGSYAFQLPFPRITDPKLRQTVLSAEVTLDSGGRLKDQIVLQTKR